VTTALSSLFDDLSARTVLVTAVDLALVYYLIYRVLLMIKGTRAAQMVVGIVLIGAGFFVADRLELTTVSWVLDNFISYFIIIVIVVFQRDIRRALGRIGQGVLPFGRGREAAGMLDEVVAAAAQLARARIGAIVVLERDASIIELIDEATPIEARLSRQLLVAMFVPSRDNELHDGAVVIGKTGRIEAARALLPLSKARLGAEMGTRHRAALGITEDCDAIAVVVSEERGEISVCFRGSIAQDVDVATLRRALRSLIDRRSPEGEEAMAAVEVGRALGSLGTTSETRRPGTETT
jgi:diadenylate cyclase